MWPNQLKIIRYSVILAVLAILALVGFVGAKPWPIANNFLEPKLRAALQHDTDYAVESLGAATFRALPWPTLDVYDVALRKPASSHEYVLIPKLKARLNVASWLIGPPRFVSLTLIRPTLHLASAEKLNETEAVSAAVLNFIRSDKRPDLRKLRVREATIVLDGQAWISNLNINVANVAATDLRLRANLLYRDVPLALKADIAQGDVGSGRPITWRIAGPGILTRFSGVLFGSRSFDAEGFLEFSANATRENAQILGVGQIFGLKLISADFLDGLALSGTTRVAWPAIQIRDAKIRMGKDRLDGSLAASFENDIPRFSATLGADSLNPLPLLEKISSALTPQIETANWMQQPLPTEWLRSGQIDLRLSIDKLLLGSLALEKTAVSLHQNHGRFEVILSESRFGKGSLKGRGLILNSGQNVEARASVNFDQIDIGILQDGSNISRLQGVASGVFSAESSGVTGADMLQMAQGRGNLSMRNGEIIGIDIERILTRLARETPGTVSLGGRSRFQSLSASMRMDASVMTLVESELRMPGLRVPLEGNIDLNRQTFDLQAQLQPAINLSRFGEVTIKIDGPWSKPVMTPQFTPRQNRSEIRN